MCHIKNHFTQWQTPRFNWWRLGHPGPRCPPGPPPPVWWLWRCPSCWATTTPPWPGEWTSGHWGEDHDVMSGVTCHSPDTEEDHPVLDRGPAVRHRQGPVPEHWDQHQGGEADRAAHLTIMVQHPVFSEPLPALSSLHRAPGPSQGSVCSSRMPAPLDWVCWVRRGSGIRGFSEIHPELFFF